jgi:hypothetical protein
MKQLTNTITIMLFKTVSENTQSKEPITEVFCMPEGEMAHISVKLTSMHCTMMWYFTQILQLNVYLNWVTREEGNTGFLKQSNWIQDNATGFRFVFFIRSARTCYRVHISTYLLDFTWNMQVKFPVFLLLPIYEKSDSQENMCQCKGSQNIFAYRTDQYCHLL